ncbi:uncharacterized protein LOC119013648 isoform X2 [Acanthopagrus latus]|uniref:uncharacterized protein LOC119013648 isoform X2 n=1 Tax=Acanthopagrus latus TaxID=8177 RepID=UPI00187C39CF|nr:uncharacterized protein LOC119013648 isoform X2 [Acanthopagrus latus]
MAKKRSLSGLTCEEEEEYNGISPNKKRSVQYNADEDKEVNNDKGDTEQPGPSTQDAHTQTTPEIIHAGAQSVGFLDVTCGNKIGVLDKEKLERGEKCIKCDGSRYTPPEFEVLGGKRSSRKWKQSILHKNEPLQCLFDRGVLTTKGYKSRQSTPKKQKKKQSSHKIISLDSSSEDSEIQTAEESDEEAVKDEDWLPSSGDLVLEAEEERFEAENGGEVLDSNVDVSKEEDEMEEGAVEDDDVPSGDADDSSVSEEREPKGIVSTPEKRALQTDVKVVIKKLTETTTDCQSNHMEPPLEDRWRQSLDEDIQNEEDQQYKVSGIDETAATDTGPSKMSDPPNTEGVLEENGEEFTQNVGHVTKSQRVLGECKYQNRDATTSCQQAAEVIQLNTRIPQTTQASHNTQSFNMVDAPSYRPSTSCDLDTMDLDQLRREKIKIQIKVLMLQEEYYRSLCGSLVPSLNKQIYR